MKIEWNKVTWYSKLLAVAVFMATLLIGIGIGMRYQHVIDLTEFTNSVSIWTDGFARTPTGERCGGFIRNAPKCPANYHCVLGKNPDTGGTCRHD